MNLHDLYVQSCRGASHRIWIFSDLQQSLPEMAEDCLSIALEDMRDLGLDLTQLWYLGDAMEGRDPDRIARMLTMQVERLGALNLPVRFIMGNHDLDLTNALPAGDAPVLPAYEAFRSVPGWRSTETFTDFYFTEVFGNVLVVFLSDHVAPDNAWRATQQGLRGSHPEAYPHALEAYERLRREMEDWRGPVILAGHYAFPGGARGAPEGGLLERLLPLPDSVKLIFHGHAHTGDWPYGKAKTFQRIGWVDWHAVPQVNVSSLDRTRGSQTRSVVLHMHSDGTMGLFFRDHEDGMWSEAFWIDAAAPRTRSDASIRHHQRRTSFEGTDLSRWQQQHPTS